MRILAIDPGNIQSAIVIWDGRTACEKYILPNSEVLKSVQHGAQMLRVEMLAIEQIKSYGMSVGESVFETCVWTGRFMQKWLECRPEGSLVRVPRKEICLHLCDSVRAKDGNIRQALIDRLGAPGTRKNPGLTHGIAKDLWAALAVGVTVYDRMQCGYYAKPAA